MNLEHHKNPDGIFQFLRSYYLRYHPVHCVITFFTALLLGVIAAIFAAAIGPAIYSLTLTDSENTIAVVDLVGHNLAPSVSFLLNKDTINTRLLTLYLPLFVLFFGLLRATLMIVHSFMWERCGERVALRLRNELMSLYLCLNPQQRYQKKKIVCW